MTDPVLVDGRSCKGCTLCCKVLRVPEIDKPKGEWCRHCTVDIGCSIHADRYDVCRAFHCGYLTTPQIGEHWRPSVSRMVVVPELGGERISINVDTDFPDIWRTPQYHADLRLWARWGASDMVGVVVTIGNRAVVILPDRDVDMGIVSEDEQIVMRETADRYGTRLDALKLRNDDPRLTGVTPGVVHRLDGGGA